VISDTKQYLETWYRAAALWLKRKGGPRWRVDHVFMWNLNSWDVQVRGGTRVAGLHNDCAIFMAAGLHVYGCNVARLCWVHHRWWSCTSL
jgi:hypothetical protein